MNNTSSESKESQVLIRLAEQRRVCTVLKESIHNLFVRLANVVREGGSVSTDEDVPQAVLVPLARDIQSNTDVLESLKLEIDDFTNRLEN